MMARVARVGLVAVAVLLVAASAGPGPASAQSAPRHDAQVVRVSILDHPLWTDGVPRDGRVESIVHNPGDAPISYRIDYTWTSSGAAMPLNGDASTSFDVSTAPLAPGETRIHEAPWRLQAGQVGRGAVGARVTATQPGLTDADASNDAKVTDVDVEDRRLAFAIVGPAVAVDPDGTAFFRVRIDNLGNSRATVALRAEAVQPDDRLQLTLDRATVSVDGGATTNATLYARFVPDGDFLPFETSIAVHADPGYGPGWSGQTPAVSSRQQAGLDGFAFTAAGPADETKVPQGQPRVARLQITNTGSRADNYTFTVSGVAGWSASPTPLRLALFPGESATTDLVLQAGASVTKGSAAAFGIDVRASLLPSAHRVTVVARASGAAPQVTQVDIEGTPYVGDSPRVQVIVTNRGDQLLDEGSQVHLRVQPPKGQATTTIHDVGSLAAGGQRVLVLSMPTQSNGGPLVASAQLALPGQPLGAAVSDSALVHAPAFVVHPPLAAAGHPGGTVPYRLAPYAFRVTNNGNAPEVLRLAALVASGTAALDGEDSLLLAPGETRTVPARQVLPSPAGAATASHLSLRVTLDARPMSWQASVATAIQDRDVPLIRPGAQPTLWNAGTPMPVSATVEDDGRIAAVSAMLVGPDGSRVTAQLVPATGILWNGTIVPTALGDSTLVFSAVDAAGNRANASAIPVRIEPVPGPRVFLLGVQQVLAHNATIGVEVADDRTITSLTATFRQGANLVRRDLQMVDGRASLDLSGLEPGPVQLLVQARNAAGAAGESSAQFNVTPPAEAPAGTGQPGARGAGHPGAIWALAALAWASRRVRRAS